MDEAAWAAKMRAVEEALYHAACILLPDESARQAAMQETARRAWAEQSGAHQEADFPAWAVRLTIRICREIRRKGRFSAPEDAPLGNLPEHQQLALVLTLLDGWTLPQTARALGVPTGLARIWLHQARKNLRMDEEGKEAYVP